MPKRLKPVAFLLAFFFLDAGYARPADRAEPRRVSFAVVGDLPYTWAEEARFPEFIEEINTDRELAFAVHVGDFKDGGGTPCSDEVFLRVKGWFDLFQHPLIYTPGDNEWTDCHRAGSGSYDPLERLAKLREIFFADNRSLGQKKIPLKRQSEDPARAKFRENARWVAGNVLFATLHVVGSNNNFGRTPEGDEEYAERMAATVPWMREAFAMARMQAVDAVVLFIHANPRFERRRSERSGFKVFLEALEKEVLAFNKPVLLVHGDTHTFRVDKPLVHQADQRAIDNFTRLETYGSPFVRWIKVTIDEGHPEFFKFEQRLLPSDWHERSPD